jgi:hypothetical protein
MIQFLALIRLQDTIDADTLQSTTKYEKSASE